MIHYLKVWPEFIPALVDGSKTFELRKDDRSYAVGDSLHLQEWLTATGAYGQWTQERVVTYKLSGPSWGILDGFCVLGLSPVVAPVRGVDRDPLKSVRLLHSLINESLSRNPSLELLREGCRRLLAELEVREVGGKPEAAPVPVATDDPTIAGLMGDRGIRGQATNNIGREDAEAVLRDIRAGRVPGICVAAPVRVDNASVCRFLERLRYTDDNVHVSLYSAAADGSYVDDVHVLNGVWSTEELRAAILSALGER